MILERCKVCYGTCLYKSTAGYTLRYGMLYVFKKYTLFHEYSNKYRVDVEDGQTEGQRGLPRALSISNSLNTLGTLLQPKVVPTLPNFF